MATATADAVFALRPMGLGDLLDAVIRLYRGHFGLMVRIGAVVYVPLGVIYVVSSALLFAGLDMEIDAESPYPSYDTELVLAGAIGMTLFFLLFWLTVPLVQGAVAKAIAEVYLGREATVGSAYGFALRRWPTLIAVAFLGGIITTAVSVIVAAPAVPLIISSGLPVTGEWTTNAIVAVALAFFLVVVGVHAAMALGVRLYFAALVAVLEEEGAIRSLVRSWELTTGHFWRVLLALLVLALFVSVGVMILIVPAQLITAVVGIASMALAQSLNGAFQALTQVVLQPIQSVGAVLLYYDLRMRKEGFDLVMMAEAIGEPELAVRAAGGEAMPALFGPTAPHTSQHNPVTGDEPENTHHTA